MSELHAFAIFIFAMIGAGTVLIGLAMALQTAAQRYYDRTN